MKIINNNKMDLQTLKKAISKPKIFEKSTDKFWDDEHVSEQMLGFHLNPDIEAASKTKDTIEAETNFIIKTTDMDNKKAVLDLGCGPGLYVKEFAKTGAYVRGVDISDRSIQFAKENIQSKYKNTSFYRMNYLDIDYKNYFDIATLIFYDFCALNTDEQSQLLKNIHDALRKDGMFILDVVSEYKETSITSNISIIDGGFWSPKPYIEIFNSFMYEEPKTEGLQYTIINGEGETKVIRIYHRLFSLDEIETLLENHKFKVERVYKNLKGDALDSNSETYGIVARKI